MSNLIEITLGNIGRTITGKTPSSEDPEDFGDGYPFVTPTDSLESKYVLRTARQLSDDGIRKLKSKVLPPESVLVSCIGSAMGKVVMNSTPCITNQQFNSIVVNVDRFCPHYVYYLLRNSYKLLRNAASGSTALPMLNKTDFEKLKICVFKDKAHQRKIVSVLSALDAKIELNNRINEELEGVAKLLYDYWFVQFDFPITAAQAAAMGKPKLEGKPYRASGGKMVYSEALKWEIPAEWRHSTIGQTFKTHLGGTPSRENEDYWTPGEVNWLSSGENPSTFVVAPDEQISKLGLQNSPAKLLPVGTVILSIVRHLRASILGIEAATNQSVVGIVETSAFKHCFIYPYLVREIPRLMVLRTGAQQPHINKAVLDESLLVVPDESTMGAYTKKAAPLFLQMENCHRQNKELTELRDWLLPMLMNGQVTVG